MEKIKLLWFEDERMFMETEDSKTYSIPLEVFPALKEASPKERNNFYIWDDGQSIRWGSIDEDIHISAFFKEYKLMPQNPVSDLFKSFPQLNVCEVAKVIGIHKNLLFQYIYGVKQPSQEMFADIKSAFHSIGQKFLAV